MVTDWRSGARASIAGRKPSGGWSAAVSCWPSKGDRRWPAPQPSPSRTTKTSDSLRPSKGGPVTGVGDIQLDQAGAVQLRTGVGDLTVEQDGGDAELTTGSGSVRIDHIDGEAVVKNSNGDTWIGEVTGNLQVNAANGRISVDRARETVAAKSANGDVRLGEVAHGAVLAQTAFGKVEIGIRDGVAAWLDLNTRFGNVHNDLDAAERPESGEDAVEVRARTAFGDITVHRSSADNPGKDET